MKKIIIIALSILLLTGCANYTELNQLGIVDILAIEKVEENYVVTMHLLKTDKKSETTSQIITSHGETLNDALENLYLKTDKKIFLAHINTLLLNEEMLSIDLKPLLNYFLKSNESRSTFTPILLKNIKAADILKIIEDESLNDYLEMNRKELGFSFPLTFEEFARTYLSNTLSNIIPAIKVEEDMIEIDSYGYFKDKKFKGYLTKEEAMTYNLLKNKNSPVKFQINCNNNSTTIKIQELLTTTSSKEKNISYHITGTYQVLNNTCQKNDEDILNFIKGEIKESIEDLVKKEKEEQTDFLGLTNHIYQHNYPFYEKNKDNLLQTITTDVTLDITREKRDSFD